MRITSMINGFVAGTLAVCCLLAAASGQGRAMTIVAKGQPKATIVVAADPNDKVKVGAEDLQAYIEKISGAKLPMVTDAENPQGALILVGSSKLTDGLKVEIPSGLTNARREEGFVIVCKGDRLLLAGNNEGPYHGTEYAVYDFLNRLGVRWFMPGDFGEVVPKQDTITFADINVTVKPDFVMRNWWLHTTPEMAQLEARWKIRNKMNPEWMFAVPGDSSVRSVLAADKYAKEHPEYYAKNQDGTTNEAYPNLSNPEIVQIAAGVIKDYFRNNPSANSYGFAPDDGLPRDYTPETVKLNQGFVELGGRPGVPSEVSVSEEWQTFVKKVTDEVRKEFPDVYIATNGYANRDIPPQGVTVDDHLVVMFAAIWSCTIHSYDDDRCWQKTLQGQMLKRWSEMCKNVWIYGYNYQMLVSALTPLPEFTKLRRDFPLMKKWGVMGFADETRNAWMECGIPSRYLRARLEWDADLDVDALLADFFGKWYGKAAEPMQAFYSALDEAIAQTPLHGHEDRMLPWVYTPELMKELPKHLAKAEQVADTERTKLHVRADRIIYQHLQEYLALTAAEAAGDFAQAATRAQAMLDLRKGLTDINTFFVIPEEGTGYASGVWYWNMTDRRNFYQSLADNTSGKTGDLVALLPEKAMFKTDPHDDGTFAEWYKPRFKETDWVPILTTKPFYSQSKDYEDEQGHTYLGNMWYRLKVNVPASAKGKKIMLYAPVVETEAWCWVNGQYIGHRPYMEAYIRPIQMELDVTKAIRPGETNYIAIRVNTSLGAAQVADGLESRLFLYSPK